MSQPRGRRGRHSANLVAAPDLPLPLLLLLLLLLPLLGTAAGQMITGSVSVIGSVGGDSGPTALRTASGSLPASSLVASDGQALYKMLIPSLQVEGIAGLTNRSDYVDAVGSAARFGYIADFAITYDGRRAYVADEWNSCIRLVDVATGNVTTFATANVIFSTPSAVTLSPDGGAFLYVADRDTKGIVKINLGTGQASYVTLPNWSREPIGLTMGTDQNRLFVSTTSYGIYAVNLQDATASLLDAAPQRGLSLRATSDGKYLFVVDTNWNAVRVVDVVRGGSRWICSPGGAAPSAGGLPASGTLETCLLGQPQGIVQVDARAFYISDKSRAILKLVYDADFVLTTVLTTPPVTTPAPTFAPPPVFTPKALSTTVPPTTASLAPAGNGTAASISGGGGGDGGGSLGLPLGVGLSVAVLVALGFGLCIFFAVRDYRKNKNNPVTPFSRAVSFAVRSFRNSFGRGRFQHDGRRPLAESNTSIASSAAAAAGGGGGRTAASASFDALPGGGGRRPATASAGRQDRPHSAAAASSSGAWQQQQQQPRQLASSQPAGGSLTAAEVAAAGGVRPPAAGHSPSYDVLHRQKTDEHHYEAMPSLELRLRPGSLASATGGPSGAGASAASFGVGAGRGGSHIPTTPTYGSYPHAAPAAPAHALASAQQQQQQRRPLPPGVGDVGGPLAARPGAADLYGPSAASSYRASAPAGRGVAELPLSPSRLAASPEARSPLSNPTYGFVPAAGAQWTPTDNGRGQQLGRPPAVGGAAGATVSLGSGEPTGTARSVNV